jgi:DNA-binding NarL/FixJ family response regulator
VKILIVDDHPVMRAGVRNCLHDLDAATDFLEAADLQEAMRAAKAAGSKDPIDLVLLDLALPDRLGVQTLIAFREAVDPCPPVVVFSATEDADTVTAALDAGAMGFIPKTSSPQVLQQALRLVLARGIYLPASVLRRRGSARPAPAGPASRPVRKLSELGLTPRQQHVCSLMVKGRPVKQIARDLGISASTVKAHLQPILRSLGAMNRTEAIVALHSQGFSLGD